MLLAHLHQLFTLRIDKMYLQFRRKSDGLYPITPDQLRNIHRSHVSFGPDVTPEVADMLGYDVVQIADQPSINTDAQVCSAIDPQLIDSKWVQGWAVRDLTEAEKQAALNIAIAEVTQDAERIARQKREQVVAGISPAEMASWPIKRAEALAYQASQSTADAPSLQIEATARGISLDVLVEKVLVKAQALAVLEAGIAGRCGAIQDQAKACTAPSLVRALDVNSGWPL